MTEKERLAVQFILNAADRGSLWLFRFYLVATHGQNFWDAVALGGAQSAAKQFHEDRRLHCASYMQAYSDAIAVQHGWACQPAIVLNPFRSGNEPDWLT